MLMQDAELVRRGPRGIEIRLEPMRLRWEWDNLPTGDGHFVRITFDATVRAIDSATDRAMLEESLLHARSTATSRDVVSLFAPALRSAAAKSVAELTAENAVTDATRPAILDRLTQAAKTVAFSSGLEVAPPLAVEIDCPSLRQEQAAALESRRADERSARQISQLRRSQELFKEFQSLRQSSSSLTPGQILSTFADTDQSQMLAALLAAQASAQPSSLWFVAGPAIWRIVDGAAPLAPAINLPESLGPLRSINPSTIDAHPVLLAGASRGVWIIDPASAAPPIPFDMPGLNSPMGFNSAQIAAGRLWASHSQAGLVAWDLNMPHAPVTVMADMIEAQSPRRLHARDDRILFSAGASVCTVDPDGQLKKSPLDSASSSILGLVPAENWCALVGADGQVRRLDPLSLTPAAGAQQRCGPVSAAARLPWLDSSRLLLATEDGPVFCVGFDDTLVTQYISPHRGLRVLAASPNRIAAVTSDRQRLIQWNTWDGTRVVSDIHIASVARHRIADIAFVPDVK
jgi:hypothetical protein